MAREFQNQCLEEDETICVPLFLLQPLRLLISSLKKRLPTLHPSVSSRHQVFQFALSAILPLRCPPLLVCTQSLYTYLRRRYTSIGVYPGIYMSLPSTSVSYPLSPSGSLVKSSPPPAALSETSPFDTFCRPPFRPMFPYFRFSFPRAPPPLQHISLVSPFPCVRNGCLCTVPVIGSLHNFSLNFGTRNVMYFRLKNSHIYSRRRPLDPLM